MPRPGRRRWCADDLDPIHIDDFAGFAPRHAAALDARSTSSEPGFIDLTISALTSFGAGRPGSGPS